MLRSLSGVFAALVILALGCGRVVNHPPDVSAGPIPSPKTVEPGGVVQLVFEVQDPDGDEMEYVWTQNPAEPAGHFSDSHSRTPTWTAPEGVKEPTHFLLQVNVMDSGGGGVLGTTPSVLVRVP
ncbi:hypothetical protein HUA74_27675 [Myxococcus sp. CA051A]|uniref:hypothetical protein n=1 Tax=Myxococcus TaxID=32 RepID=UPI00157A488B|nr:MULTISPECIES: hypothetical protein [Myxococcus]NTX05353.1 hypothetical protein [Myxococcus sp. CA040A]NTX09980.1 hypothetical protein [Myxococcus sp. CA056]NTX40066.1 hypothetical protein [Myxococcus sp. CA033]NTX56998.1 hypothetical protein [Myxococcus sp. CA039A]NTX64442.1 hypothetical protein [Myxococcus sp. CA051A]